MLPLHNCLLAFNVTIGSSAAILVQNLVFVSRNVVDLPLVFITLKFNDGLCWWGLIFIHCSLRKLLQSRSLHFHREIFLNYLITIFLFSPWNACYLYVTCTFLLSLIPNLFFLFHISVFFSPFFGDCLNIVFHTFCFLLQLPCFNFQSPVSISYYITCWPYIMETMSYSLVRLFIGE